MLWLPIRLTVLGQQPRVHGMPIRRASIVRMETGVVAPTLRAIIATRDHLNSGARCGLHWLADTVRRPPTDWSLSIGDNSH